MLQDYEYEEEEEEVREAFESTNKDVIGKAETDDGDIRIEQRVQLPRQSKQGPKAGSSAKRCEKIMISYKMILPSECAIS